jgi:hypothetical protein
MKFEADVAGAQAAGSKGTLVRIGKFRSSDLEGFQFGPMWCSIPLLICRLLHCRHIRVGSDGSLAGAFGESRVRLCGRAGAGGGWEECGSEARGAGTRERRPVNA